MLSQAYLKERVLYDSDTGIMIWKSKPECDGEARRWNSRYADREVSSRLTKKGYRRIGIDGAHYFLHRLAYFYVTNEWPDEQIDHINEIKTDNRFSNFRLASNAENQRNRGKNLNNSSGFKGVTWHKATQKWLAQIRAGPKNVYLGVYSSKEDAIDAYKQAAIKLHGEFAKWT